MNLTKRQKALFFFGFYLLFFIAFFTIVNNSKKNIPKVEVEEKEKDTDKTLYFTELLDINYQYTIEVNDNNEINKYQGTKDSIDYKECKYKYFFDLYNINQLIKKSKVIEKIDNYSKYSLDNKELNDLLETESQGNTIIEIKEGEELEINLDLHEYYQKDVFQIKILLKEGDIVD